MSETVVALDVCFLTPEEFEKLSEYSCTVPTDVIVGKKWKRHQPYIRDCKDFSDCMSKGHHWLLGEYRIDKYNNMARDDVFIFWLRIQLKS